VTKGSRSSRIAGFYNLSLKELLIELAKRGNLSPEDIAALDGTAGLTAFQAEHMIENAIGLHALPLGIALNFLINGQEILVPMAIEEPSVVAGVSFMAKLARAGGGFQAYSSPPEMIAQIQLLDVPDMQGARHAILDQKESLLAEVGESDPVLKKLGGGPRDLEVRLISESPIGAFLVAHLIYDVRDAMGANALNTAAEWLAPRLAALSGGRVHLRILSNLADRRLARARCVIPLAELAFDDYSGEEVREGIIAAWAFAAVDPYRAATHNKGIMNGVDAVGTPA